MEGLEPVPEVHAEAETIRPWWHVLVFGLLLYVVGIGVMVLTGNELLFPAVLLLGSFVVPVTYVVFFYGHGRASRVTVPTVAMSFFYGGVLGAFAASLLEPALVSRSGVASFVVIGLVEEFAKILGVLAVASRMRVKSQMGGLVVGAAAGMGFAALESIGYAFVMFMQSHGNLPAVLQMTLTRGLLSPIGHGTWTAILAAILFREARGGRIHINYRVFAAYLAVAGLHGLWDVLPGVMAAFELPMLSHLIAGALVGAVGVLLLWTIWRDSVKLEEEREVAAAATPLDEAPGA
jgi:protease PrsW